MRNEQAMGVSSRPGCTAAQAHWLLSALLSALLIAALSALPGTARTAERGSKTAAEPQRKLAEPRRTARPRKGAVASEAGARGSMRRPSDARNGARTALVRKAGGRNSATATSPWRVAAGKTIGRPVAGAAARRGIAGAAAGSGIAGAAAGRGIAGAAAGRGIADAPGATRVDPRSRRLPPRLETRLRKPDPVVPVAQLRPPRPSIGQTLGLHEDHAQLALRSSVALMLDASSGQVLFEKNAGAVLPIASITKLMTAMVVLDAGLPLGEPLSISEADIDTARFTRSRLRPGTVLTRDEMLKLALMSSENRAAHALGRHYPGGLPVFIARMNAKAREIGMTDSRFVEPTGLSSSNVSNAYDLARLVSAASRYPLIRAHSTAVGLTVLAGSRSVSFRNTNRLTRDPDWEIGLQKTGYISEAGNCLVMQTIIEGRPTVLVLLDAEGKLSRFGDARRLRDWLESAPRFDRGPHASALSLHAWTRSSHASLESWHALLKSSHASLRSSHALLRSWHASLRSSHASLRSSHASLRSSHASLQSSYAFIQSSRGS